MAETSSLLQIRRARQEELPGDHAPALAEDLRSRLSGEVRFDPGSRALYSTDGSNYRQLPIGVVVPRTIEDVVEAVATCRRHGAPLLSRGCGTSLAGQCCNAAVVMDMSKHLDRILDLDPDRRRARVLPGTILDRLRTAANAHDLTFGPDPATHTHCTLGGMIGNNSCGPHAVMAGRTADNVEELEILTYDGLRMRVGATSPRDLDTLIAQGGRRGDIYRRLRDLRDRYAALVRERFPRIPRRVSGYNLDELLPERGFHVARALVGSEGTLVTVLEATVRLVPWPRHRALLVIGYPDVYQAGDDVPWFIESGAIALEGFDALLPGFMRKKGLNQRELGLLPEGQGTLMLELGADSARDVEDKARQLMAALDRRGSALDVRLYLDPKDQERVWTIRESGLGATARVPGEHDTWPGWEDSAVPPDRVGDYLRALRGLFERHGYTASLYGHFGQGCIHCRIDFELRTPRGIARFRAFMEEAADLVVRFGGSLSGEHGDGQARAELLGRMYGPELLEAFREFKRIWDPAGKMNPGKVVDPYPMDANLRLGPEHAPPRLETHFAYQDDDGSFARAALRCVGVGKCRRLDSGVMCPSFMATREEMHSTRGRARLLFEMSRGGVLEGWRDEHVRQSLDLCLACKACKGECPLNVDMATYKAEFMAHHYRGRLRPRHAYAMGHIARWARLARWAPGLANLVSHAPGLAAAFKALGGIAPQREIPRFAARTFQQRLGDRARSGRGDGASGGGTRVLLWPDTFTNHFHPDTGLAAVGALERLGFQVEVPRQPLCCGRPLYEFGFLPRARRQLRAVLRALREPLRAGVPIVGLEPSCVSVFRDELLGLLPDDEDARRLASQALHFPELVAKHAADLAVPRLEGAAMLQGHCHLKSTGGLEEEAGLLARLGLETHVLDAGCCGMAGAFGFEAGEKYELSLRVGEQRLLPAVRGALRGTRIVAAGFSCREQIGQQTGRRALHPAEVLWQAYAGASDPRSTAEPPPERAAELDPRPPAAVGAALGLLAAVGWAARDFSAPGHLRRWGGRRLVGSLTVGGVGALALAWLARAQQAREGNRWPSRPRRG